MTVRSRRTDRFDEAVDWLLNSRYTADPDIQEPFWAYVDGLITRDELGRFGAAEVRARRPTDDGTSTAVGTAGGGQPNAPDPQPDATRVDRLPEE